MKKLPAFKSDYDDRTFYATARSAREAEFDYLMDRVTQQIGYQEAELIRVPISILARNLRSSVYPSCVKAFLMAADYLREHHAVLIGTTPDPEEIDQ